MAKKASILVHDTAIEHRPISELKPNSRNARTHSPRQLRKLRDAIRAIGWIDPIIINDEGNVLAGHARLEVARMEDLETVPTIRVGGLTEAHKRAYLLNANRLAELAGWDRDVLAEELSFLVESGEAAISGFDDCEIDSLLSVGESEDEESVELPSPEDEPVSQPGDLWRVGAHLLLHGDALAATSYDILLTGQTAELTLTDPPFNIRIPGMVSGLGRKKHKDFLQASGEMSSAEFTTFLRTSFRHIARNSNSGSIAFIFMDWRHQREILDASDGVFKDLKNLIIWSKSNAGMGSFYRSQHELVFAFQVSKGPVINNFELGQHGRHRSNIWQYAGCSSFGKGRKAALSSHPTAKPVRLLVDAILDCSHRNGLVLDPFAGSGSTLVAAHRAGRRGAGIELDGLYVDIALRRLMKETGETARLESGETFDEVAALRLGGAGR